MQPVTVSCDSRHTLPFAVESSCAEDELPNWGVEMVGIPTSSAKEGRTKPPFEQCLDALGEAHNENVYSAIERLVQASEQVGFTVQDLIRLLSGGMSLEALLDNIEVRMTVTFLPKESGRSLVATRGASPRNEQ